MSRRTYPPLPGVTADDHLDTVINWGLGADSTAYLARVLTDPAAHGIDLERTVVLCMATGSEWPETRLLVDTGNPGYQKMRNGGSSRPVQPCCWAERSAKPFSRANFSVCSSGGMRYPGSDSSRGTRLSMKRALAPYSGHSALAHAATSFMPALPG